MYLAGARDLADRTLYQKSLTLGTYPLSSHEFNLPPLSAAWALPLAWLPVEVGGVIWQYMGAGAIAVAALVAAWATTLRRPWVWAGIGLGMLSVTLVYLEGLHLGTNNYLTLGFVAGFTWTYLRGNSRWAGVLLALAIATKLWPLVLLVPVLRDRRWAVGAWCAGVLVVQAVAFTMWLGIGSWLDMAHMIVIHIPPTGVLIGPTAVPGLREVWNSGLGIAAAAFLLLIPGRRRIGIGLAVLAGLCPIANLWVHYAPTLLFAGMLMAVDAWNGRPPGLCGHHAQPETS